MTVEERILDNLPLVGHIVKSVNSNTVADEDDLLQAGRIGLMQAAREYDETRGVAFPTFATQRIRGAMLDELRRADFITRRGRQHERNGRWVPSMHTFSTIAANAHTFTSGADEYEDAVFEAPSAAPDVSDMAVAKDLLEQALIPFSREARLMILLRYVEGFSFRAIGETIGITESRVCQLFRGGERDGEGIDSRLQAKLLRLMEAA